MPTPISDPLLDESFFQLLNDIQTRLHRLEISRPDATGPLSGGGLIIADEGADLPARARLSFQGTSVAATDDAANNRSIVTIASGGPVVEAWHLVGSGGAEPGFQNGWVNNDAANAPARFRKMPDGTVLLGGMIRSGTIGGPPGGTIFTLPLGYHPAYPLRFACVANGAFAWLEVDSSGRVYFNSGSNVWADLSPASFVAEA